VIVSQTMEALAFIPVPELEMTQQFELLSIRNQQIIRESSYSSHVIEDNEHLRWIKRLQTDPTVLFYAVTHKNEIVGGVGLRNIDAKTKSAEWSFYVSQTAIGQGIGLALGVCALDIFFETLNLKHVIGEALIANAPSMAYHAKLGFLKIAQQQHLVLPGNHMADIAVFSVSREEWCVVRKKLCGES